jgi:formamidopyrimidine-DNA glycosylase
MPELPEVETVARTLHPLISGRHITDVELRWERTLQAGDPASFAASILGRRIDRVGRRAKLILFHLDDGSAISVHLRMTGELLFRDGATPRAAQREPYLRAVFQLSGDAELLFYDTRKFGRIAYLPPGTLGQVDRRYGIEPLSDSFTAAELARILGSRARQIKPLLLDQAVIAGLGNIYVDEALHRAGIHPLSHSAEIDEARIERLYTAIREVLQTAIDLHGTTFRDYRSGIGEPGENQSRLLVYGRKAGSPCLTCGAGLARLVIGQRGSTYCPTCQPVPSPPARDRSPRRRSDRMD